MLKRQLLIQEGIMAMPLNKLVKRTIAINLVTVLIQYGFMASIYFLYKRSTQHAEDPNNKI